MRATKTPPTIPTAKFHQYPCAAETIDGVYSPTIAIELNPLLSEVVTDVAEALAVLVFSAARAATASWPVRVMPSETIVVSDGMEKTVSSMDVGVVVLEEAATKNSSMDSDDSAVATLYRLAKFVQYSVATYLKMAQ